MILRIHRSAVLGVAIPIVIAGSLMWNTRSEYSIVGTNSEIDALAIRNLRVLSDGDQLEGCERLMEGGGSILFVVETNIFADDTFRGVFETAPNSRGMFVEYDPADSKHSMVLRLGIPSTSDVLLMPLRVVRKSEKLLMVIGMDNEGLRVVSNTIDHRTTFQPDFVPSPICDAVQIGSADAAKCAGCSVSVRYAHDLESGELDTVLDSISNRAIFDFKRLAGTVLVLVGTFMVFSCRKSSTSHPQITGNAAEKGRRFQQSQHD